MATPRLTVLLRRLYRGVPPAPAGVATDREVLGAFVATRDEAAFAELVRRHGPMVLRVCRRVLGHAQDAEDAFQATFLVLARKAAAIGRAESLPSWLHGVAFRTAMRARRDAGRRRARESQAPVPDPPQPLDDLAWRDVQVLLEAEIRRLPEPYRAAFVLCHLQGRSRAEAAAELGVEENTLSSRLARARDRLRDRLARRGVHLSAVLAAITLTTGEAGLAIPTDLLSTAARAGAQFAARQPVTGVSAYSLQLTNEAMKNMAITKLKWAAGLLAAGSTLAVGTWGLGQGPGGPPGPQGSPPPAEARDAKPAAGDRTADFAQRQRSLKNLKQIARAILNYHDTNNQFPTDITDKSGKALLSWRVELLPYLAPYNENHNLHRQFHRDEPWDSEHNLKLLAQLPDVFRAGFEPKGATHTYYQRFAIAGLAAAGAPAGEGGFGGGPAGPAAPGAFGPGGGLLPPGPDGVPRKLAPPAAPAGSGPAVPATPADPGVGGAPAGPRFPSSFAEVTDGLSNTLGVIEAGPPVPWTKPADLVYDRSQPPPKLTGPFANVRHAATLDGATYALKPEVDETTLRRLIDPNDGQITPDLKPLRARFPADTEADKKALAKLVEDNQALIDAIEKLSAENAALLRLYAKSTRDVDQAEATQEWLEWTLQNLKAVNKKYRDEFGLPPNRPLPKELQKE